MLLDPEVNELKIQAAHGLPAEVIAAARKRVGDPVAGVVAATGQPLLLQGGPEQNPQFAREMRHGRISSSLCLPLALNRQPFGVLNLNKIHPGCPFRQRDVELHGVLAAQAALAIRRLQLEEERVRTEKMAMLGQMASMVVHDLKTPMTVIRAAAEMLEDLSPDNTHYARMIAGETDRLTEMCQDLLTFSRGAAGLKREPWSAGHFLAVMANLLQPMLTTTGIELVQEITHDAWVSIDRKRLERVFLNLASNARDAMPQGGHLRLAVETQEQAVVFVVEDTGCGIPDEVMKRLFEPFFTYGKSHGTGLGLAIVKNVVEAHGGDIDVASQPDRGTTFRITLPAVAA
jgi:signal transduction histidine kinase